MPKPHLSGELVRWSRTFLWPGVSSGSASHKTEVFLTLSVITDKTKSAPTSVIQTSCKSALPRLYGRRMFPSARKESCLIRSPLLNDVVFMAHFSMGWMRRRPRLFPWCSDVRKLIVFHHPFLREFSPPKIKENSNAKNTYMEKKTRSTFMWYQGPATLW